MRINLSDFARRFLKNTYGVTLDIPLITADLEKHVKGQFEYGLEGARRIWLSNDMIQNDDLREILDTVIHECIHYALFIKGLPHKDKDTLFKSELLKHTLI